ncbi:vitamin K epoxide reductase family protein [Actinomadura sp. 3N407]|uniref:vitamin K epoxide reductase family protein n=1 Tax=Actinomadura sp. 3N407 TaxID=3457423 RepID=UPI003FCE43B6
MAGLDADRVDAAPEAYRVLQTADAAVGPASAGVTLTLVGMGPDNRAATRPWLAMVSAAKVAIDAVTAGLLLAEQVTKHRRVCSWCTLAALSSMASLPLALPEARAALAELRTRRQ